MFIIVVPCRNAAGSLAWLLKNLQEQQYPRDRFQCTLVLDTFEGESDESLKLAREFRVHVVERHNPDVLTKGEALNHAFRTYLKDQAFDAVVLLDVDARIEPLFLRQAANRLAAGATIVQGATRSKNPETNALSRVGDAVQSVIRVHQLGRSLLGLDPILIGSHGLVIRRNVFEKLDWVLCNGQHLGDDLEFNLRRFMAGVRATYAPELRVTNDLPTEYRDVRSQRRRWSALSYEALAEFFIPLLKSAPTLGIVRTAEVFVSLLILPSFATLFLCLTTAVLLTTTLAFWDLRFVLPACIAFFLWLYDVFYFLLAFRVMPTAFRWSDTPDLVRFLGIRASSVVEGVWLAWGSRSRNRWPTTHRDDQQLIAPARAEVNRD